MTATPDNDNQPSAPGTAAAFDAFANSIAKGDALALDAALQASPALIQAQDEEGWNGVIWAAATGQHAVAQFLIDRGADANHAAKDGRTALMAAAETADARMATLLLDKGAKNRQTDAENRTAADYAREVGADELAVTIAGYVPPKGLTLGRDMAVGHALKIGRRAP